MPTPSRQAWFLIAATLLLLLCGSSTLPLIDRDEPRFAEATREMMTRHNWLVPTFNGDYRFDKPPLTYWAMSVFYRLGGVNELTARLHSILSTLVLVLVLYAAGRRWFSGTVGFAAAFGFITSLQVLLHGRLSVADMPMVLAVAVAQFTLFEILSGAEEDKKGRHCRFWTLYLALAAGFLAKGPITLAVPLLTALLYRFAFWRKPLPWARLRIGWGLLLVLSLVGLWGIPGLIETHGLWWKVGMGEHVIDRGYGALNSRSWFAPYYLLSALLSYFPWVAFAGYGVLVLRRNWNEKNAFLLSWFLAPYLIFTFYATQLPHYILPAFPAFFLILAQAIEFPAPLPRWPRFIAGGVFGLFFLLFAALVTIIAAAPWTTELRPFRIALIGLAAVLGGLLALGLLCGLGKRTQAKGAVLLVALGFLLLGAGLRPILPALPVAEIAASLPPDARCIGYGFTEGSLIFYTNRHWILMNDPAEFTAEMAKPGPALIVVLDRETRIDSVLKWLPRRLLGLPATLKVDSRLPDSEHPTPSILLSPNNRKTSVSGINFARASWVTVTILVRE